MINIPLSLSHFRSGGYETTPEARKWLHEHMAHGWRLQYGNIANLPWTELWLYMAFDSEEDATLFTLRWL